MKNRLLILLIFIQLNAFGKTHEVAAGGSIRQAIALAQPFDTILVKSGYYRDNQLVIKGPLSINA